MNLVQIRTPGEVSEASGHPLDGFLGCHERIRRFTQLSGKLAAGPVEPEAAAEAARAILRYFTVALPLHESDEDLSLAPLLRRVKAPDNVLQAAEVMTRQHPDIDRVIGRMVGMWQAIAGDPSKLAPVAEQLGRATERLTEIWMPHLMLEETTIFPAARELLLGEDLAQLHEEMRQRHAVAPVP